MVDLGAPTASSLSRFMSTVNCMAKQHAPGTDGPHACLFRPAGQLGACAAQLNATGAWPTVSELTGVEATLRNTSLLIVGDSTLESAHVVLQEVLKQTRSSCQTGAGNCFVRAGKQRIERRPKACPESLPSRGDFDVILFNAGMHFLSPAYRERPGFTEYFRMLRECAASLRQHYPQALPIYMLTNRICEESWRDAFAADAVRMRGRTESYSYNMQWSDIGVQTVRVAEREMAREQGWLLLDGRTADHCACTGLRDGRHFLPLMPHLLLRVARVIETHPNRTTYQSPISVTTYDSQNTSLRNVRN